MEKNKYLYYSLINIVNIVFCIILIVSSGGKYIYKYFT